LNSFDEDLGKVLLQIAKGHQNLLARDGDPIEIMLTINGGERREGHPLGEEAVFI
jgi:hypothetical protein